MTISSPYIAINMNEGTTFVFIAEYAPVALPGLMKYFPSYYWTPNS